MKALNIFFTVFLISSSAFAQVSQAEQDALKDLYRFTHGNSWNVTWDLNKDVKTWAGVEVEDDKVVGLDLDGNNLDGELPSSLGNLVYLERLDLSGNLLKGELPDQLGGLQSLEIIALSGNELSGEVPNSIFKLEKIKELQLADNIFDGLAVNDLENTEKF